MPVDEMSGLTIPENPTQLLDDTLSKLDTTLSRDFRTEVLRRSGHVDQSLADYSRAVAVEALISEFASTWCGTPMDVVLRAREMTDRAAVLLGTGGLRFTSIGDMLSMISVDEIESYFVDDPKSEELKKAISTRGEMERLWRDPTGEVVSVPYEVGAVIEYAREAFFDASKYLESRDPCQIQELLQGLRLKLGRVGNKDDYRHLLRTDLHEYRRSNAVEFLEDRIEVAKNALEACNSVIAAMESVEHGGPGSPSLHQFTQYESIVRGFWKQHAQLPALWCRLDPETHQCVIQRDSFSVLLSVAEVHEKGLSGPNSTTRTIVPKEIALADFEREPSRLMGEYDQETYYRGSLRSITKVIRLLEELKAIDKWCRVPVSESNSPQPLMGSLAQAERVNETQKAAISDSPAGGRVSSSGRTAAEGALQDGGELFLYSEDYATVRIRGEKFELTSQQRSIVELLHQNWMKGIPSLSKEHILCELKGTDTKYDSLQKLFRDDDAFRALIRKGKRKDTYRLNLPDKEDPPQKSENS